MGGFVWEGAQVLLERSYAACALASADGHLCLGWTGGDCRLNLLSSVDGERFDHKLTLPETSARTESRGVGMDARTSRTVPLSPALAPSGSGGLALAWTGTDRRLNLWRMRLGGEGHQILAQRSSHAPAVAGSDDETLLGWTGTDRRLNLVWASAEVLGEPWVLNERSDHAPAVAFDGHHLVLAWTGTDRVVNLVRWMGEGAPEPWRLPATSNRRPAVCTVDEDEDELVVAWTGTDRRINLLAVRGGAPVGTTILPAVTANAPALAVHHDRLYVGWTGTDRRLNVGRCRLER